MPRTRTLLSSFAASLPLALVACATSSSVPDESEPVDSSPIDVDTEQPTDADGDLVTPADGDCDDNDPNRYPGRAEDCNGIDDNCNGVVDEGLPDADRDGTADCLDSETCDGVDNNGDGVVDEGFADSDNDGVADCVGNEDCDGIDNDGDGQVDEGYDADGDGFTQCGSETEQADCDDTNGEVFPGAGEVTGDEIDNDCNGLIDEGDWEEGDLAITEMMNNPQEVVDPDGEWFEVRNMSTRTLILNGLEFSDDGGEWVQVAAGIPLTLDPGEFYVFGTNADSFTNGGAHVDYAYTAVDLSLSNESDQLYIYAGSVLIDAISWDDGATMPDASGASIGTDRGIYGSDINDVASNWCEARQPFADADGDKGSPGQDNELCGSIDHDGDGFTGDEGDCDDSDAEVYPGAWESNPTKDNDCDGEIESAPVAVADYDSDSLLVTCSPLYLDGSGSYDLEGMPLTYAWELTSAPAASSATTADIVNPTDESPTFQPDVPGTYTFTLTVDDGGASSHPDSFEIEIANRSFNTEPAANAGADQSTSGSVSCTPIDYGASYSCSDCSDYYFTLDGSGTDGDGDDLSYSWSVTSGSDYATTTATSETGLQVLFSGAPATYGSATQTDVVLSLSVTDCFGATATDEVTLSYTCTGS
jgi:hypothetical protein